MTTIRRWTGRETRELRHALRLSVRGFARYLGVAARTVATWDAQGHRIVPRPEMQAALDTALEHAGSSARQRFQSAIGRVLYVVVCGAGPASQVATLTTAAQAAGWQVHVIATPAALGFLDPADLQTRTGNPVRSAYRPPAQPRHHDAKPDAIITAPATYNTINKLAAGIADNYALTLLAESIGQGIPVVVVPFINQALAARRPLQAAVTQLRAEGVQVLLGPGGFQPHPVGAGSTQLNSFPWSQALTEATTLATAAAAADSQQ